MSFLLDTCILSEFTKRVPHPGVVRWIAERDESGLFLSVITVGEVRRGIEKLTDSRRKVELSEWLKADLLDRFGMRLIPLDAELMLFWGSFSTRLEKAGRVLPVFDSLIAATALYHNLTLVTRNASDFAGAGFTILNPWE